jgi:Fe-S cluster assembly protein SufD
MNDVLLPAALAPYRSAFESVGATSPDTAALRSAAFDHFVAAGFPSARDEAWKYTRLRRLETRRFCVAPVAPAETTVARSAAPATRVLIVDGRLLEAPDPGCRQLQGVLVRTLAQALADGEQQGALLRVPSGGGTERFAALNAALSPDAIVIDVADGAQPTGALHIALQATGESTMSHPRLLVRVGRGASAQLVVHHAGDDEAERFVNSYIEIESAPDSSLRLYRQQAQGSRTFHIERIEATVGQRAVLTVHDAELGGSISRLDLHARLAAPGAAAQLNGLFLADGSRHLDAHVRVDHLAPHTSSLVDYRGVAAGRGRAVFNGKAVVHQDAQKSDARQVSRNLLLSPGAEIDTKPELEIYADDVKCSHGATTGQLDPAALFYLRSRGLDESTARSALTRAFAAAILARMDLPDFADAVHAVLDERLARLLDTPA